MVKYTEIVVNLIGCFFDKNHIEFFHRDIIPTRLITKFQSLYIQKEIRRMLANVLLLKNTKKTFPSKIIHTRLSPRVGTYKKEATLANI